MRLFEKIVRKNQRENLIQAGDRLVVGFSGGPDSVFLVEMLLKLRESIDFNMVLVHINHLLRGEDALKDEEFSKEYGREKGLEVYTKQIDITAMGKEQGWTLEEAGRKARYDFYSEILKKSNGNKIALAHNKDDQIETFMFRLSRGTGLSGLEGIASKRENYIRPISEIYKSDILRYLDENGIAYCIDKTNFENEFTRNSIRLDLIPFIEKRYNPKFKDKIFALIEEIREINSFVNQEIDEFSKKEELEIDKLLNLTPILRGRILSNYLYNHGIDVSRKKIALVEEILTKGGSLEISLSGDFVLKKEYNSLKIDRRLIKKESVGEKRLTIPGKIEFGEYLIEAEVTQRTRESRDCFFTSLAPGDTLIVRTRVDGDRIIPKGMKGEKKLKDILINEKIPKELRDSIPVIVYDEEIVWIVGVRGSQKYSGNTEKCVKLSVRRTR